MATPRLTAKEARAKAAATKQAEAQVTEDQAEAALDLIFAAIDQAAAAGEKKVEFNWQQTCFDKTKPKIQDVFPSVVEDLWWWDGGEGRGDHPTTTGKYICKELKKLGYQVTLYNGHLDVRW